jgi:flagellar hook-length control protein FliK
MSVELSSAPSPVKPATTHEAGGAKGKSQASKDAKPGGNDVFSNLMMSLGQGDDGLNSADASGVKADKDDLLGSATSATVLPSDALLTPDAITRDSGTLMAPTGAPTGAQAKLAAGKGEAALGAGAPAAVAGTALNAADDVLGLAVASSEQNKRAMKGMAGSKALTQSSVENTLQALTQPVSKDSHEQKPTLQADMASMGKMTPEVLALAVLGDKDKNPTQSLVDKFSGKSSGTGESGMWAQQATSSTQRVDAPPASDASTGYTPEMQVAEKVNYWISQDVQRAELKLDGLGYDPIEVSISMQGKETMVEFRTDQAETRQVLEGAVDHLKDLLKGEGLVLSGVSVGSSGQNGAGSQERKERNSYRQADVVAAEVKRMESVDRPTTTTGRSIDLFV